MMLVFPDPVPEVKVVSSPYLIPCNFSLSPSNGYSWSNGFCGVVTSCNKCFPSTIPSGLYGLASHIAFLIESGSFACNASDGSL